MFFIVFFTAGVVFICFLILLHYTNLPKFQLKCITVPSGTSADFPRLFRLVVSLPDVYLWQCLMFFIGLHCLPWSIVTFLIWWDGSKGRVSFNYNGSDAFDLQSEGFLIQIDPLTVGLSLLLSVFTLIIAGCEHLHSCFVCWHGPKMLMFLFQGLYLLECAALALLLQWIHLMILLFYVLYHFTLAENWFCTSY